MPISNESTRFAATPESTTQPAKVELGLKELMAYHNPKKYAVAEPEVEAKPARETTTWFHFIAIDDEDIGFRLFRASLILSLTVLISEGWDGMDCWDRHLDAGLRCGSPRAIGLFIFRQHCLCDARQMDISFVWGLYHSPILLRG